MRKFLLSAFLLCTLYFVLCTGVAYAQAEVISPNYIIQMPNLNSGAGLPSSSNYKVSSTIGQNAAGLFSSAGFRVKSGFQYIYSIIPFSFTVSSTSINFGSLIAQTPSTATNTLTVSSGGAGGYQVKASENNPLKIGSTGTTIPDTSCDTSCSETTAGAWTSSSRYGFGFNMSGDDVPADFTNSTYYRQFANRDGAESPQIVMSSIYVGTGRESTVTYKVNISGVQPAGVYNNMITYTAIPAY
ncbi:MAG: hypothetical protein UT17_C0002G0245 [Candidatus Woesebacteria bacterium GW2011_GWB1_39_10]|nr:MAG: hypothetical protein UT17_C0002G0245 [Candidatus Woesebacteria bacterium GW2011_GWB1_39_10]KKR92404.1 MAG: hypothetical protein UU42_C0001G0008 [Candidatus Woesebacteria bacterium GW2011_GWA1_41_13b]